ncbi:N-alpha-acetyltransferase 35, NatC auxiliary subunit homolog [Phlebotomus argentipes]|uniref:N-alpha-acetyltransferase 35, NatC auxiliary subunit homolog n=1 Tax=Phlebotomus argentipes TaxID=94469 RepID=UPI00289372AD|nr:N-alpha-acetyltransferase 35, NatC auxiliary subunit homolog [Phlebotomus argentipes]
MSENQRQTEEESGCEVRQASEEESQFRTEDEVSNPMSLEQMESQGDAGSEMEKSTPTYEWKDITKDFFVAIKDLSLGELMHHELFGLFEAMSAIEMMDPKMDAGMCCKKEKPLRFHTAVSSGQLKLDNLEYRELIGVFDSIYSCLVSWLEGHSLAQTLFTCLYMHFPHAIEEKSLKAFCCAIYKLTDYIRKFITHASVFEEEDFQPSTFAYTLYPDVSDIKACSMLKEAEDELSRKGKASPENAEIIQFVVCRLKFARVLLQTFVNLWRMKSSPLTETEMNDVVRQLNNLSDIILVMRRSIERGTQPEMGADAPNPMGFSPMVNQRLLPPTFPRYTKIKDRNESVTFLEELIQRLKLACKVTACTHFYTALNFFMDFSKKSGQCLLSRSLLRFIYLNLFSVDFNSFIEYLKESAKVFIAPPVLMSRNALSSNAQARECVESFFNYTPNMHTMYVFLQICGYNRARQRDKLARLLEEFAKLQQEAQRLDTYLYMQDSKSETTSQYLACFGTWILYQCLRAMELYLLSGLELELYSVHEYLYIFWYLYEFLFGWIVSSLTRAESFLLDQDCVVDQSKASSGAKSRKAKSKKKKAKPYVREILYNQALQNVCGGFYKGLTGFVKDGRIQQPAAMFDNEKIRFDHRFAPFACLKTPPMVPYFEFRLMRSHLLKLSSAELYLAAAKHFHQGRTILESIPNPDQEMLEILRVTKVNFVVMNLLAKGHKKDSKVQPEFDFSYHRYFPVIKQQ